MYVVSKQTFNALLEEVGNKQSGWSIPDGKLRSAVVRVILQVSAQQDDLCNFLCTMYSARDHDIVCLRDM